jgi:hypothetical protein
MTSFPPSIPIADASFKNKNGKYLPVKWQLKVILDPTAQILCVLNISCHRQLYCVL